MQKTFLKYTIIKIRQKISYSAFLRKQTVLELFCRQILMSYKMTQSQNDLVNSQKVMQHMDEFTKTSSLSSCFLLLMKLNAAQGDVDIAKETM